MKNEEKDKRYVYIRVRDICIIGVIIIILSLLNNKLSHNVYSSDGDKIFIQSSTWLLNL